MLSTSVQRVCPQTSRPMRRLFLLLLVWATLCYFIFKATLVSRVDLADSVGTRELLQNVQMIVTPATVNDVSTTEAINYFEAQPAIDKSPKISEQDLVKKLQNDLPNMPIVYLSENKNKNWHYKNKTCAKFPALYDLHINNIYWQQTDTSNGTFFLYGAYLDVRKTNRLGPTVRVLGMIDRLEPKVKTFCQMWFEGSTEPVIVKVLEYKYIWYKKWGNYKPGIFQPYLMGCQIPKTHWKKIPVSVSIVENFCDTATNNLRVIYNKVAEKDKKKFAVCVKGLDFPDSDLSVKLVEWIELLTTLGADKVFLYNLEVHPNVTKVLDYFVKSGQVDLTQISLPGYQPNMPQLQHLYLKSKLNNKRQNELIPYNDCLYRNMYRYEWIALLDIDEVIMPAKHADWSEMMDDILEDSNKIKNVTRASYNFRNVYFMDEMLDAQNGGFFKDIPPYMHMMQHVYRSANYTKPGQYVKCFHNPNKALILHNHFPLGCLGGVCTSYPVPTEVGHLQHYRSTCVSTLKKTCDSFKNNSVIDTSIWRYKDPMIKRTTDTLAKLGFFRVNGGGITGTQNRIENSAIEY